MDENKNYNEAEEITEETAEVVEEAVEEAAPAVEAAAEAVQEVQEAAEIIPEEPETVKKGSKVGAIIAVVVAIVVIAAAVITSNMEFNEYNKMGYVDISGKTIQDLADAQGIEVADFLEMYSLPEDMPANTTEAAAYYNIPVGRLSEMYGMDLESLKTVLNLGEDVTAETPWGVAEGEIILSDYVGEDNVESFKTQYGLGDEVTGDTKWKEIRTTVDTIQKEQREAQEAAAAEADKDEVENDAEIEIDGDEEQGEE